MPTITLTYGSGAVTARSYSALSVKGFTAGDHTAEFPGLRFQHLDGSIAKKQAGYRRVFSLDLGCIVDGDDLAHLGLWLNNEWQYMTYGAETNVRVINRDVEFSSTWEGGAETGRHIFLVADESAIT